MDNGSYKLYLFINVQSGAIAKWFFLLIIYKITPSSYLNIIKII